MGARAKYLCWIDLETSGVDPQVDPILEVGMVITSSTMPFQELMEYSVAIGPSAEGWEDLMGSYVRQMHTKNGLLADISSGNCIDIEIAEDEMIQALGHVGKPHNFMLAGSGVGHFDFAFLKAQMPEFCQWLQYPCLDVGVIRRAFSFAGRSDLDAFGQTFATKGDKPHRGLADVRDHLNEYRRYAELFQTIDTEAVSDE